MAASLVLLALLALGFPYVERGTGTFVVAVLSAAMLGAILLASAAFVYLDWDPFDGLFA
jgi:uncharacterized membrane protein YhhN